MHKKTAVDLRDENDLLREQNASLMGPLIKAKNEEIEKWKNENENLFAKIAKLERDNTELSEGKLESFSIVFFSSAIL